MLSPNDAAMRSVAGNSHSTAMSPATCASQVQELHTRLHSAGMPSTPMSESLSASVMNRANTSANVSEFLSNPAIESSDDEADDDVDDDGNMEADGAEETQLESPDLPDVSHVNRAAPTLDPPRSVPFRLPITAGAIFREMLVVAMQDKLRVLVVRRGAFFCKEVPDTSTEVIVSQSAEHYALLGSPSNMSPTSRDLRATTLAFCPPVQLGNELAVDGRVVWYGTPAGHIGELDTQTGRITAVRLNVHKSPICHIARIGKAMVCVDESGKISTWLPRSSPLHLLSTMPETIRITIPKHSYLSVEGNLLWLCSTVVTSSKTAPKTSSHKELHVRCYSPISDTRSFNVMSRPGHWPMYGPNRLGAVTCSAMLPTMPGLVYFGHDSGHVSIWNEQGQRVDQMLVSTEPVVSMVGVLNCIWSGLSSGRIIVHIHNTGQARMVKLWHGHRDAVFSLLFNPYGLQTDAPELMVCSLSGDNYATFWDATLSREWIDADVCTKADQFASYTNIRILTTTFNLGAASPDDLFGMVDNMDLFQRILRSSYASTMLPDGSTTQMPPDVIVFALQELIDLEDKRLTAKHLLLGSNKSRRSGSSSGNNTGPSGSNKDVGSDERERLPSRYRAWLDKLVGYVRLVMPPESPFSVLLTENLLGLFTCIIVRADLLPRIRLACSYTVKTGLGGRYGNKGALISRFVIDDSSLCFINCHLAAGQRNVRQRNMDLAGILQSPCPAPPAQYDPAFVSGGDGSMVMDHEICLLAGDLNYRLDLSRDAALSLIEQKRFNDLIAADQLLLEIRMNPMSRLRDFHEAPICFAPTYKFNRLTNDYDSSEKARVPAYCDRILFRSNPPNIVQCTSYKRWDATVSDHRPVSATFSARLKSIDPAVREQVTDKSKTEFLQYRQQLLHSTYRYFQCI